MLKSIVAALCGLLALLSGCESSPRQPRTTASASPQDSTAIRKLNPLTSASQQIEPQEAALKRQQEVVAKRDAEKAQREVRKQQVIAYCDEVAEHGANLARSMDAVGNLCGEAGRSPYLLENSDWKIEVAAHLAVVEVSSEQLDAITPVPRELSSTHTYIRKLAAESRKYKSDLLFGLDNQDRASIQSAIGKMDTIKTLSGQALRESEKVKNGYGL